MPGIYGFYNPSVNAVNSIAAMSAAMRTDDSFIQDSQFVDTFFAASRAHLGHIGMKSTPSAIENKLFSWVEGEIYNLDEAIKRVSHEVDLDAGKDDFGRCLLLAYSAGRLDQFLAEIDGYYCAAIYDSTRRKISLISDRYGMRLLYWYHRKGVFCWSGEVKGILAHEGVDKTIDQTSLQIFMDMGYMMGELTWFEGVRLIKPASVMEYSIHDDQVSQRYYWKWSEIKPSGMSFDDAVDAFGPLFLAAVSRRFNPEEKIGISLSGGCDSRAILAAVHQLHPGYEGYAYTFGIPDCDDIRIAKKVAARTNWRHECFYFSNTNWYFQRLKKVWDTDGMLDMMHMHGSEFLGPIREKVSINLNGYAGDVVAGGGWFTRLPLDTRSNEANLRPFYQQYVDLSYFRDAYFDTDHVEPALFMSRVRRFTNMGTVNALTTLSQRKPFFDNKLIEFIYSLPDQYRLENHMYSEMLKRFFPKLFLDIPWQKTGKPVGLLRKKVREPRLKKILRMVKRTFSSEPRPSRDYTNYKEWIREPIVSKELERILSRSGAFYCNYSESDFARQYLLPHLAKDSVDYSNQILRAATFEIYLRQVFDNHRNN